MKRNKFQPLLYKEEVESKAKRNLIIVVSIFVIAAITLLIIHLTAPSAENFKGELLAKDTCKRFSKKGENGKLQKYVVIYEQAYLIPEEAFPNLFVQTADFIQNDDADYVFDSNFDITSDAKLVSPSDDKKRIYLVMLGEKKLIANKDTLTACGFDEQKVQVDKSILNLPFGESIDIHAQTSYYECQLFKDTRHEFKKTTGVFIMLAGQLREFYQERDFKKLYNQTFKDKEDSFHLKIPKTALISKPLKNIIIKQDYYSDGYVIFSMRNFQGINKDVYLDQCGFSTQYLGEKLEDYGFWDYEMLLLVGEYVLTYQNN